MIGRRSFLWISIAAAAAFALYASIFLCFFVDDEAIPLVYARNLLRGRGLTYTVLEGRVEGYSDFLHVVWSAVLLGVTGGLGLSPLAPIAIGKGISFAAGIGIVLVAARMMRRAGASTPGLVSGLALLAVSGPLAIWSCSSLETVVFALMVSALAALLFAGDPLRLHLATVLGAAIVLERIDGFIYAGALAAGAAAVAPLRGRQLWTLSWRLATVAAVYHAWRYLYFGSLLSAPLAAKVLHIFTGPPQAVVNAPEENYLRSFLDLYGLAAVPVFFVAGWAAWRWPAARAAAISLIGLGVYVGAVGDWMFGWRFTVALLPLAALIVALAVTRAPDRLAWVAAVVVAGWSAIAAVAFVDAFKDASRWPIFWTRPDTGVSAWLSPYGELLTAVRERLRPGDRVAYNQAGIVPYLLDLENIDDLGICSRFVARLPTTDVTFTRVGRYSPLRDRPVLFAAHAYVLYHDVRYLISRTNLLRSANGGRIPDLLLGGHFRLLLTDGSRENAVYERTATSTIPYRRDASLFTENLAHTSRLVRASVNGQAVAAASVAERFGFLRERSETLTFENAAQLDLQFADADEDVFTVYIGGVTASAPSTMTLSFLGGDGVQAARREIEIGPAGRAILERFEPGVRARTLSVRLSAPGRTAKVTIADLHVRGQSAALRDYVRENLRFAAAE